MDLNWARGKNEPYNRHGIDSVQFAASEGDFVSVTLDADGNEQLVQADAANGPAVGMVIDEVTDVTVYEGENANQDLDNLAWDLAYKNKTLVGDRLSVWRYGVEVVNDDADTDWTEGEPVYLDEGGGLTQAPPTAAGSVRQRVGVALGKDDQGRDRMGLAVEEDFAYQGEDTFSGDATNSVTTFTIPHGMTKEPSFAHVEAKSADAAGDFYLSTDATNIVVEYTTAPADGTDNVVLEWKAEL